MSPVIKYVNIPVTQKAKQLEQLSGLKSNLLFIGPKSKSNQKKAAFTIAMYIPIIMFF